MKNSVHLIGNIGNEPEFRQISEKRCVLNLRLATSERYKKGDEWVEQTEWHNIVIWDRDAKNLQNILKKGMLLAILGKIQYRKYTPSGSNEEKWITEIKVRDVDILSKKEENQARTSAPASTPEPAPQQQAPQGNLDLDVPIG